MTHDLSSPVKTDSSFWTILYAVNARDKQTHVIIYAFHDIINTMTNFVFSTTNLHNPGFDFSQAQFSGNCPDPRTFIC
uniref:Uncharacterized protein n=1 Tax=Helianthus annuus TaxID=4232 RepID=A0A251T5Y4_HELAN